MTQITQVASETLIVQVVSPVPTTSTTKIDIPVVEIVLDRILKAMEAAGWDWDGSINQVDNFCHQNMIRDWSKLTPSKRSRVIYVQYNYAI